MGTRGVTGVIIDGIEKIGYQQFDSYPSGVGIITLNALKKNDISKLKELAKSLKAVQENATPTKKEIELLKNYADLTVSDGKLENWYCLLRKTQGDLKAILDCGYIIDSKDFLNNSLFCEWGYIVNFDTNKLEIYQGFQKQKHDKGRYSNNLKEDDLAYYPCALIKEYDLKSLPTKKKFLSDLEDTSEYY